jgi:hypothetical protein
MYVIDTVTKRPALEIFGCSLKQAYVEKFMSSDGYSGRDGLDCPILDRRCDGGQRRSL